MVGVTPTKVYGLDGRSRRKDPGEILFAVPREGLTAKVRQRVNVRVLELVEEETGSRIELEGEQAPDNPIPRTCWTFSRSRRSG
jgi:hypothetical protein